MLSRTQMGYTKMALFCVNCQHDVIAKSPLSPVSNECEVAFPILPSLLTGLTPPPNCSLAAQVKIALSEGVKAVWCNPKDSNSMITELIGLGSPRGPSDAAGRSNGGVGGRDDHPGQVCGRSADADDAP